MDTLIQMRIDTKTKVKASKVFKKLGMDMSTGLRIYLNKVAGTGDASFDEDLAVFLNQSGKEVLKITGPISKEEYDYYESLK